MRAFVAVLGAMSAAAIAPAQTLPLSSPTPAPTDPTTTAGTTAATGRRAAENAVRSADDAFGTSIGLETIGRYNSGNVRGLSPTAAGNIRIDSLFFDQVWGLNSRLRRTTNIRVRLSALGIPFPAPTGIVYYGFRKPGDAAAPRRPSPGRRHRPPYRAQRRLAPAAVDRLSLDIGASHQSDQIATGNNTVVMPARTIVALGGRYAFKLGGKAATLGVSASNIFDVEGFT